MPAKSHGLSGTAEYRTWQAMKQRCHNPKADKYYMYGAKGIRVSDEWRESFQQFLSDMGPKPTSNHSIERVDGTKGYFKDNCVWATAQEQSSNIAHNRWMTYQGRTRTLAQWSNELGIPVPTLINRLDYRNMSIDQAFTYRPFQRVKQ